MKSIKFLSSTLLIMMFSLGVVFSQSISKDKEVKIKTSAQCEKCKTKIETNLKKEPGISKADLDLKTKVVTVTYNSGKTDLTKVKTVISKSGYDADEMKADKTAYDNLHSCCKKPGSK